MQTNKRNPTKQHIRALLRKNWILFKRSCCCSCCEILMPILFAFLLIAIRSRIPKDDIPQTSYLSSGDLIALPMFSHQDDFLYVALSPDCYFTNRIAKKLENLTNYKIKTKYFASDQEIDDYIRHIDYGTVDKRPALSFGVTFDDFSQHHYIYSLRFNVSGNDAVINTNTYGTTAKYYPENVDQVRKYVDSSFIYLQNMIDNLIFAEENNNQTLNSKINLTSVEVPAYVLDKLSDRLQDTAQIYVVFPWIIIFLRFLYRLLYEKERKITEGMKMMGMSNTAFYVSWLITYGIISFISVLLTTLLFKVFFQNSNFILLFLWEWLFVLCLLAQALFVSVFFTRPRSGIMAGLLFFFIQYYVNQMVNSSSDVDISIKTGASIAPHAAMSFASAVFLKFETLGVGVNFETINEEINDYKVSICFGMVIMNLLVYLILAIYLDQVIPNEFGKKKHPLFFLDCLKRFFHNSDENGISNQVTPKLRTKIELPPAKDIDNSNLQILNNDEKNSILSNPEKDIMEPVDANLRQQEAHHQTLSLKNLSKVYPNGKRALVDLSLTMYQGQIFALLGHNGAGKTTTLSILTGLIEATSGMASVFGYDILNNMDEIRHFLGVCPQHDILYDQLTVKEHLILFATFKGVPKERIADEVSQMIKTVGLEDKTNFRTKNLSGGQKRKLSVAIAYIGDSKLILLDEPTSGMDTSARRFVWEMLKNNKTNKIVILTTHFMDEADFLGDRIGIMSSGLLKCCGSSIFLKNRFGIGYNLTIVKRETKPNPLIRSVVLGIIPKANLLSDVSAEICFQLPLDTMSSFSHLFKEIDENKQKLGVLSYGVSITTLEEVFLKVAEGDLNHRKVEKEGDMAAYDNIDDFDMKSIKTASCFGLFWLRLTALITKRLRYLKRDYKGLLGEILMPVLVIIVGLCLMLISFNHDASARNITINSYSSPLILFSGQIGNEMTQYFPESVLPVHLFGENITNWNNQLYSIRHQKNASITLGGYYFKEIDPSKNLYNVLIEGDTRYTDSYPLLVNMLNQAIIRSKYKTNDLIIKVKNAPFPETQKQIDLKKNLSAIFSVFVFAIGMSLIPSSLIVYIVKESQYNIKHAQLVSGAGLLSYWFSNLIVDWVKVLIPTFFSALMCKAFNISAFLEDDCYAAIWLLFIFYGFSIITFTYVISFFFKDYGSAQTVSFNLNFLMGGIAPLIFFILRILDDKTKNIASGIAMILRLIPSFSFGYGILNVSERSLYAVKAGEKTKRSAFDTEIAGFDIIYLIILSFGYFIMVFLIEKLSVMPSFSRFFSRNGKNPYKSKKYDSDVQKERNAVAKFSPENYSIIVNQLRKVFASSKSNFKVAVDSVSFAIPNGECFGLLGVNGAGKTTTFKMLCGEIPPTSGEVYIAGYNIFENLDKIRENIGYCPQFDALLDLLTTREHLELFAALKGIPKNITAKLIDKKLNEMNLRPFEHVCAGTYSGGNKRKLSVALAMLGNPPIVFLDEPSTGMDPEARRFMWNVISRISTERKKSSIILTTHSMEEAEALSNRIAIMVNGSFQCLGSVQHIKHKFGKGYELEFKLKLPSFGEMEDLLRSIGKKREMRVHRKELEGILRGLGRGDLMKEIRVGGFGSHIYHDIDNPNGIAVEVLMEFVNNEIEGMRLMEFLRSAFGESNIIEHFQTFFRVKLQADVSIGNLFKAFEENKAMLKISQYSIKQATIEQIFNMFAAGQISGNQEEIDQNLLRKSSSLLANDDVNKKANELILEDIEGPPKPIEEFTE